MPTTLKKAKKVKPIPGFPLYEITDSGEVYNTRRGRRIKFKVGHNGHLTVKLFRNGVRYYRGVHRLLALTFLGDPPEGKTMVCHIDGNPQNNELSNLYWGDSRSNAADMVRHGRSLKGTKHHKCKITEEQARAAILAYRRGELPYYIAKELPIQTSSVVKLVKGENWKHLHAELDREAANSKKKTK